MNSLPSRAGEISHVIARRGFRAEAAEAAEGVQDASGDCFVGKNSLLAMTFGETSPHRPSYVTGIADVGRRTK